MAATENQYYELLVRTDHPVFKRDFATLQDADSPFNSIMNRIMAKQLKRFRDDLESVKKNSFPNLADALSIDQWETTYFKFTKPGLDLATRVTELLIKINSRIGLTVADVIKAAQSITGKTPIVIRNAFFGGWTLDVSALDVDSIFSGTNQATDAQTYIVIFSEIIDSFLLQKLDEELTKIEKGGSQHVIISQPNFWYLDINKLDVDTILG